MIRHLMIWGGLRKMNDERFKVDYEVGVLDTKTDEIICDTVNAEEVVALLNKQQKKIDNLIKEKILMEYQLKVQDRIIDDYERQG